MINRRNFIRGLITSVFGLFSLDGLAKAVEVKKEEPLKIFGFDIVNKSYLNEDYRLEKCFSGVVYVSRGVKTKEDFRIVEKWLQDQGMYKLPTGWIRLHAGFTLDVFGKRVEFKIIDEDRR